MVAASGVVSLNARQQLNRRDFLARVLALGSGGIALVGLGTGIAGLGSPGPNSPGFTGAFILKKPPVNQTLDSTNGFTSYQGTRLVDGIIAGSLIGKSIFQFPGIVTQILDAELGAMYARGFNIIDPTIGGAIGGVVHGLNSIPSIDFPGAISTLFADQNPEHYFQGPNNFPDYLGNPPQPYVGVASYNWKGAELREVILSSEVWDADNLGFPVNASAVQWPRAIFIDRGNFGGHIDRFAWREDTTITNLNHALSFEIDGPTGATPIRSTRLGTPGVSTHLSPVDHAHPIDAIAISGFLKTAVAAGFPLKFLRFKFELPITIRRLSVYAQNAPTVGTDTFGVINAAGTLQGTAVALAAGVKENETGVQTTGLASTTIYYLAQTASTSTIQSTDINLVLEYTLT